MGEGCLLSSMLHVYISIYLVTGMSRFTVQSVIVCGVNLFAMPRMQCVVYAIQYKVVKSPYCKPVVVYYLSP